MKKRMILIFTLALVGIFGGILLFGVILPGGASGGNYSKKLTIESGTGRHEFMVEVADTITSRARGLSGRAGLTENQGMFFIFGSQDMHGFWMKDMKFPIDIVWIRGEKIVEFAENAAPEPADKVLEIKAGLAEKLELKVGDKIIFLNKKEG